MASGKGLSQARKILGSSGKEQKTVSNPDKSKEYQSLYQGISIGDCVLRDDKTGIVVDKFTNSGGIPQAWVCWGTCKTPYPEYPSLDGGWGIQVLPSCRLSDAPSVQQEAA